MVRAALYGLDVVIEGERIASVGFSLDGCDELFDGDEIRLLTELDELLAELPPGVLVTWQGGIVDLPVLAARAAALGVDVGLRVRPDARDRRSSPVGGVTGGCCGAWYRHRHLDLARVYDPARPRVMRVLRGRSTEELIPPVDESTEHDPRRDAHLARCLAERRWGRARRLVDRMPAVPAGGGIFAPVLEPARSTA